METPTIPQNPTELAHSLGYPVTFLGFTPDQPAYWREPGLPWLPADWHKQGPATAHGPGVWAFADVQGEHMAPRFPKGCALNLAPVADRAALQVGKVYVYYFREGFRSGAPGAWMGHLGRLEAVHPDWLSIRFDHPGPGHPSGLAVWLLGDHGELAGEHWYLCQVTHYVRYPSEDEQLASR